MAVSRISHINIGHTKSEVLHFKNTRVFSREFDIRALFRLIMNVNKDSSLKVKARTKDSKSPMLSLRTIKDQGQGRHPCILPSYRYRLRLLLGSTLLCKLGPISRPGYAFDLLPHWQSLMLNVRHTQLSTVGDQAFPLIAAARTWNSLHKHVTSAHSMSVFRGRLKAFLFRRSFPWLLPQLS